MRNIRFSIRLLLLWICSPFLFGCMSYRYSNKQAGERTVITALEFEKPLELTDIIELNNPSELSRGFASTDLLIQGANLAIDGVKLLIDESRKKYHAEYKAGLNNLKFYNKNSELGMLDPQGIHFKGFTFQRSFQVKNSDREIAVYARFSLDEGKLPDIYHNSKFYLKVDSLRIDYAKVKVNDSRWYMPWTWFYKKQKEFHLDLNIDLLVNWIDESGLIHSNVPFGHFVLPVHNVPLNPDENVKMKYFQSFRNKSLSGSSYIIPRSATYCSDGRGRFTPCFGRGDFSVSISVTESSKTDFVHRLILENSGELAQLKGDDWIKNLKKKIK